MSIPSKKSNNNCSLSKRLNCRRMTVLNIALHELEFQNWIVYHCEIMNSNKLSTIK